VRRPEASGTYAESGSNPSSTPARSAGTADGMTSGSRLSAAARGEREVDRAGPKARMGRGAGGAATGLPAMAG
jgi:hypothetical protein